MNENIRLCRDGVISPEIALTRLVLAGIDPAEIAAMAVAAASLAALVATRPQAAAELAAMVVDCGMTHDGGDLAQVRALFDRAVAHSPETSVAAYSLGDPAVLRQATDELLAWLDAERLIWPAAEVLDVGCGIGRVAAALAPFVRSVHGIDVSPGMVAQAKARHSGLANVRFAVTSGTGLSGEAVDLVLAVDSFPYLVQAGVAEAHVAAAATLLRPGGALAICNLSYRGDPDADARDAARWAMALGMRLDICGERPFQLWDGAAFVWRKP